MNKTGKSRYRSTPARRPREVFTERSRASNRSIVDFERGACSPYASPLLAIRSALEAAGVDLTDAQANAPGE